MTVIAYRDGIIAGDSCWSDGADGSYAGLITNMQNKLCRLPGGAIYGGAGATDDRALLRLLHGVTDPRGLPDASTLSGDVYDQLTALVILPDRSVWLLNGGPSGNGVEPVSTRFTAIGCGGPIAVGAMARGASAEQAVRIACQWNVYCRPPTHTINLKE